MVVRFLIVFLVSVAVLLGAEIEGGGEGLASTQGSQASSIARTPAAASGDFGLELIGAQPPGNVVIAPGSIATALAMAGTGAAGLTAAQIAEVLHLRGPAEFDRVGNLQRTVARQQLAAGRGHAKAATLRTANGLFVQQGFALKPAFTNRLQRHFGAAPEAVDFENDPFGSLAAINSWVSDRTDGLIPELLGSLPDDTRLVLSNALYLQAEWLHRFDPADTLPGPFYGRKGATRVEFMHQVESLRYAAGRGYRAVELPYRASTLSLLVVLPRGKSVTALQRRLLAGGLARVENRLSTETVELRLPRFHLNTRASLRGTLNALGMPVAFSDAADFSRITAEELKIDAVEHVADLTVDEDGTVAAAATGVVFAPKSAHAPFRAIEFNANRPFLFFVRDRGTGAVLFAGRLTNPAPAGSG